MIKHGQIFHFQLWDTCVSFVCDRNVEKNDDVFGGLDTSYTRVLSVGIRIPLSKSILMKNFQHKYQDIVTPIVYVV